MNRILQRALQDSIIDSDWDFVAANLLEWPLGERIVYAVCKGILEVAEENGETVEDTVEEIIEEHEEDFKI